MSNYNEGSITEVANMHAVRKRPGMYIGATNERGLYHLLQEIVDNSTDEAIGGFCNHIEITLHKDKSISVKDNGRGVPIGKLESCFTILHSSGKMGGGGYANGAGGLHGVGATAVTALSEYTEITIWRDGRKVFKRYENVKKDEPLVEVGTASTTGTEVRFKPDATMFSCDIDYDFMTVVEKMRVRSYLYPGLKFTIKDKNTGAETVLKSKDGLLGMLNDTIGEHKPVTIPFIINEKAVVPKNPKNGELSITLTMAYADIRETDPIKSFINGIVNRSGGTHLEGALKGIQNALNRVGEKSKLFTKSTSSLTLRDIKEDLILVLSVNYNLDDLQFIGQTKDELSNSEFTPIIENAVAESLFKQMNKQEEFKTMIHRLIQIKEAKAKARKDRELLGKKSESVSKLVPKLMECICKEPSECEIYLIEGDSAGGTVGEAKDEFYQAALPLRGKIENVFKSSGVINPEKHISIKSIIIALGCGINANYDFDKLRYHKIILLPDADPDGGHIEALILALIWCLMPDLIMKGCVYVCRPPLFGVRTKKGIDLYQDVDELNTFLATVPPEKRNSLAITRYKGLGEMNASELRHSLDPKTRSLIKVTPEGVEGIVLKMMSGDSTYRKEMLDVYVKTLS